MYSDWREKILGRSAFTVHVLFSDRKIFVLIIHCRKIFGSLIFVAVQAYENILTTKFSRFMVHAQHLLWLGGISNSYLVNFLPGLEVVV